jgi:hypothetical protein
MKSTENFIAKISMIRQRLEKIRLRQKEHVRQFNRLKKWNINFKALINVLNTISVTSLVLTFSGSETTLIVCTVTNSLSAIGTAILSVINMDAKVHSHQTSYLQFVELHDTYIAELLHDDLSGLDLDRILIDLNTKVGLILDHCEPIELAEPSRTVNPIYPENIPTYRSVNPTYVPPYSPHVSQTYQPISPLVLPAQSSPRSSEFYQHHVQTPNQLPSQNSDHNSLSVKKDPIHSASPPVSEEPSRQINYPSKRIADDEDTLRTLSISIYKP